MGYNIGGVMNKILSSEKTVVLPLVGDNSGSSIDMGYEVASSWQVDDTSKGAAYVSASYLYLIWLEMRV